MQQLTFFLAATVRMATPLLIAALGLIVSERAGLMNIGVEGTMLSGAFAAFAISYYTHPMCWVCWPVCWQAVLWRCSLQWRLSAFALRKS